MSTNKSMWAEHEWHSLCLTLLMPHSHSVAPIPCCAVLRYSDLWDCRWRLCLPMWPVKHCGSVCHCTSQSPTSTHQQCRTSCCDRLVPVASPNGVGKGHMPISIKATLSHCRIKCKPAEHCHSFRWYAWASHALVKVPSLLWHTTFVMIMFVKESCSTIFRLG